MSLTREIASTLRPSARTVGGKHEFTDQDSTLSRAWIRKQLRQADELSSGRKARARAYPRLFDGRYVPQLVAPRSRQAVSGLWGANPAGQSRSYHQCFSHFNPCLVPVHHGHQELDRIMRPDDRVWMHQLIISGIIDTS